MFKDRSDAGRQLGERLTGYRGKNAVIEALPRGGVVTGFEVAKILDIPLDVIAVRKIGHPASPEYAIGAVDERGTTLLSEVASPGVCSNFAERRCGSPCSRTAG